jgi:predicted XRE-type DNA-binding protein
VNKRAAKRATKPAFEKSSGNVFADLGVPNPEDALAKAKLAHAIRAQIDAARLDQAAAAQRLGIDQPKVSALKRGRLKGFSIERLMRFLTLLGNDIEIRVQRHTGQGMPEIRVREQAAV